jgi:hypothetical protein
VLSYQTAGDFARFNPHWHGILLEGGFDEKGNFVYLPISNTKQITEFYRQLVIKHFVDKKLINENFAQNLLSWKNSGFSIDNSVRIFSSDGKAKEALAQYIARCPISLKKIRYEAFHGKVLFKTPKYNNYFKENFRTFDALDFIAEVTAHIPPKNKQYIRRYGLSTSLNSYYKNKRCIYASRTRGTWYRFEHIVRLAPSGWKEKNKQEFATDVHVPETQECSVDEKKRKSTWAAFPKETGLIKKVYGTDPLICPKCQSEMKIIAIILEPKEITKILKHLIKIGRAPPNVDSDSLN